jgi:hypothetical protein
MKSQKWCENFVDSHTTRGFHYVLMSALRVTMLFSYLHFRHRYNLEELHGMLAQLKRRADSFDNWASEVRRSLDASAQAKVCKYYILSDWCKTSKFIFLLTPG